LSSQLSWMPPSVKRPIVGHRRHADDRLPQREGRRVGANELAAREVAQERRRIVDRVDAERERVGLLVLDDEHRDLDLRDARVEQVEGSLEGRERRRLAADERERDRGRVLELRVQRFAAHGPGLGRLRRIGDHGAAEDLELRHVGDLDLVLAQHAAEHAAGLGAADLRARWRDLHVLAQRQRRLLGRDLGDELEEGLRQVASEEVLLRHQAVDADEHVATELQPQPGITLLGRLLARILTLRILPDRGGITAEPPAQRTSADAGRRTTADDRTLDGGRFEPARRTGRTAGRQEAGGRTQDAAGAGRNGQRGGGTRSGTRHGGWRQLRWHEPRRRAV
jgi:hypothetical protein